ncbi:MAG: Glycosyl transferases group 1 [Tenericutes bacterium ADurb.Bin024]|nr:MAG: Glycosyl transferases group 1 [Tenericutes bacterium ADurb.Bin024]
MKRVLFVASLPTKKMCFDGERNKSRDVLNAIKKMGEAKIDIIDYSKNKYLQTVKLIIKSFFKKYDFIFVSKCIVGGSLAIHLIHLFKKQRGKVFFYLIGNGYDGFEQKKIYFEDIAKCRHLIVESPIVADSMVKKGNDQKQISVFPCIKPNYDLDVLEKKYPVNGPLRIIYFSRINRHKGLDDLLDVVIRINEESKTTKFVLDVSGGVSNEPETIQFNKEVIETCSKYSYLNYIGLSLKIDGQGSYKRLQQYDLHVFPSKFVQECAPGAILDMFVAGIPTLSSTFPSYKFLLNVDNSFFFEQNNKEDLYNKLIYIYDNQKELEQRRFKSHDEYFKYTETTFVKLLNNIGFDL